MIELSIDRATLGLAPLVITDNPFVGNLHLPEEGLVWPVFETRRTYAPDSAYAAGRMLLAAVKGEAELPLTVYAKAGDSSALLGVMAEFEAAVAQWSYDLTLTVDGVPRAYSAEIVLGVPWGPIDSGMVRAHMARASFSIPLQP